jgi:hypothetical protein
MATTRRTSAGSKARRKASSKAGTGRAKSSRDKVRAHRARLRQQGLRPIQVWVPDVTSPEFKCLAREQTLAIARSEQEADDLAFVESLIEWPPDEFDVETR